MNDKYITFLTKRRIRDHSTKFFAVLSISFPLLIAAAVWIRSPAFVSRHPGAVLVFVGVVGEGAEILTKIFCHKWAEKRERLLDAVGGMFWIILILGLWIEFSEAAQSDIEVKRLQSDNLVLQARVLELQAEAGPRIITDKQISDFMALTKDYPKMPIEVFVGAADNETVRFAREINDMLKQAGYGMTNKDIMHTSPTVAGLTEITNTVNLSQFAVFSIIGGHTNGEFLYGPLVWDQKIGTTNSVPRIPGQMTKTNTPELHNAIFVCVAWAFNQIGLTNYLHLDNVEFKTNEFAIFVPLKNH